MNQTYICRDIFIIDLSRGRVEQFEKNCYLFATTVATILAPFLEFSKQSVGNDVCLRSNLPNETSKRNAEGVVEQEAMSPWKDMDIIRRKKPRAIPLVPFFFFSSRGKLVAGNAKI